jgi:hypothetical protein
LGRGLGWSWGLWLWVDLVKTGHHELAAGHQGVGSGALTSTKIYAAHCGKGIPQVLRRGGHSQEGGWAADGVAVSRNGPTG